MKARNFIIIFGLLLSACGGGGGSDTASSNTGAGNNNGSTGGGSTGGGGSSTLQGVFFDAPVEGIRFQSSTQSGFTDVGGIFTYQANEVIEFYISDIFLGSAIGAEMVTPVDLVSGAVDETDSQVTNILRFIQSLDSDADLQNGIQISTLTSDSLVAQSLDFSLSLSPFEVSYNALSSAVLGGILLPSVSEARAHFVSSFYFLDDESDFGSLSIIDSNQETTSFVPTNSTGSSAGAADGFLQTIWGTQGVDMKTLTLSISDDYFGVSGSDITFGGPLPEYECESGFVGSYGNCDGANFYHSIRVVRFSNVELQAAGLGDVITLNGALKY